MNLDAATVEQTVKEILGEMSCQFEFAEDSKLVTALVTALMNENCSVMKHKEDTASFAVELIRNHIWDALVWRNTDSDAFIVDSAVTTCNLFYTLGRESELGWIKEQAGSSYGFGGRPRL